MFFLFHLSYLILNYKNDIPLNYNNIGKSQSKKNEKLKKILKMKGLLQKKHEIEFKQKLTFQNWRVIEGFASKQIMSIEIDDIIRLVYHAYIQ